MAEVIFEELGFPVLLVDPPMVEVRGCFVPDINIRELQASVFSRLIVKSTRLTGAEVRFVRTYLRMRQADLARVLNKANHSVVSQWESRADQSAGMGYNTEVVLRIWMAAKVGNEQQIVALMESSLRGLKPDSHRPPHVHIYHPALEEEAE